MDLDATLVKWFRDAARFGTFFGLKGYFAREDVRGLERLDQSPTARPQIVAANHYGGKLDSVLIWTHLGRKVGDRAAFPGKRSSSSPP
jgi:1-acyl-sn-glycerol-3-phosphate acyltransferase